MVVRGIAISHQKGRMDYYGTLDQFPRIFVP